MNRHSGKSSVSGRPGKSRMSGRPSKNSVRGTVPKFFWEISMVWLLVFTTLWFLVHGTYGFNDDYVIVGQVNQAHMDFFALAKWALGSPFSAGRFVGDLLGAIAAPFLSAISQLEILRIVAVIGWAFVSSFLYFIARTLGLRKTLSLALCLVPIIIPGSQLTIISGTNFPYSWATLLALIVGWRIGLDRHTSFTRTVVFLIAAQISTMVYQPSIEYILVIPAFYWILNPNTKKIAFNFWTAIGIYFASLLINWSLAKLLYDSSRLNGSVNFPFNIRSYFHDIFPMALMPHLFIFRPDLARELYVFVFLLSLLAFWVARKRLGTPISTSPKYLVLDILVALGLVPLTLGWLLFLPGNGVDFRQIFWGSSAWVIVLVLNLGLLFPQRNKYGTLLISAFCIATLFLWTPFVRYSTVDLQIREWDSAMCASKSVGLTPTSNLASQDLLLNYPARKFIFKDEIAVQSLTFPGPRVFMPWLSHNLLRPGNRLPSAWKIQMTEVGAAEGKSWSADFKNCWLK